VIPLMLSSHASDLFHAFWIMWRKKACQCL